MIKPKNLLFLSLLFFALFFNSSCNRTTEEPVQEAPPAVVREPGHIFFLCGWKNEDKDYSEKLPLMLEKLSQQYTNTDFTVEQWKWNCGGECDDWLKLSGYYVQTENNADSDAVTLAEKLMELPPVERQNTVLVGHSIGCRVILRALAILNQHSEQIKQAILFAAAMPQEDPDIQLAFQASQEPVLSFIHPQDGVLMSASAFDNVPQMGLGLMLENVSDLNCKELAVANNEILDSIFGVDIDQYKQNHSFENFFKIWMNGEWNAYSNILLAPQDSPNIKSQVVDGEVFWNRLSEYEDTNENLWKLQKNTYTGHCRIICSCNRGNGPSYRFASGREEYMKKSYNRIVQQLAQ